MTARLLLGIDEGTTAVKAALSDPAILAGIGAAVAGHIHVD